MNDKKQMRDIPDMIRKVMRYYTQIHLMQLEHKSE